MLLGLLSSWFEKIIEFISGLFAFIPMSVYFIYTSIGSVLDLFQALVRKLAGLDTYYVNGKAQSGDILVSFMKGILGVEGGAEYSVLSTVFWSLIIFSVILLVLATIISVIKAHYNYDAKKSNPYTIISNSIKALFTMALVPIVSLIGIYLSQAILQQLDQITSASSGSNIASVYGSQVSELKSFGQTRYEGGKEIATGATIYASYDAFGFGNPTTTATFSGSMFSVAAYDCNRVRLGSYSPQSAAGDSAWQNFGIFIDDGKDPEVIANKIDTAFANRLTLNNSKFASVDGSDSWVNASAYYVGAGAAYRVPMLFGTSTFSKYDVGLVWYFYNLWSFNYFLGFAGIITCLTLFINIIFGLMSRLIMCLALFLIYSPLVGITPLDGGNGFKSWKKEFMSNVLMAYGAVLGMNVFFLILPFLNTISFFNNPVLDRIMNMLIIITGLTMIKKFIKIVSGFAGGADANEVGGGIKDDVKKTGMQAAKSTMGAATVGVGAMALGKKVLTDPGQFIGNKVHNVRVRNALGLAKGAKIGERENKLFKERKMMLKYRDANTSKQDIKAAYKNNDKEARKKLWNETDSNGRNVSERVKRGDAHNKLTRFGLKTGKAFQKSSQAIASRAHKMTHRKDGSARAWTVPFSAAGAALKATGKGLLDIGGASMKLAGDLTGIGKFAKDLKESGITDAFKMTAQKMSDVTGKSSSWEKDSNGKAKIPESLQTEKQKEDAKKAKADEEKETQKKIAENTTATLNSINELIKTLNPDKK